ncbi:DUF4037 domain-containing protein [Anaerococcus sp. AGMB00486]|uniref:DUF4037 domain-containing protein n=1 Tax=Anaerococcus faecalis TaxID=2742993 RepID=A0ABX2N9Z3_9FIRM|nr:DUF4037 domain-containing protein [Anaerococcus faecalis]NVF11524.1 DUF4037 domain-containing protein [Anaerococcus faecalis]
MKAIELSKNYFYDVAYPIFKKEYPQIEDIWATGLVGEGSENFRLDDEISKDHDYGPGFCIWLKEEDKIKHQRKIEEILKKIPKKYMGYERIETATSGKRTGLFSIEEFYYKYTSFRKFPIEDIDFLKIPESYLATATNGEVFFDNCKIFTRYRLYLKEFYPDDVLKKKLAAYLFQMGQAGQYNLKRSLDRKDIGGVFLSKSEFIEGLFGSLFLLAKVYMPYYKLRLRRLKQIDYYPKELMNDIEKFILSNDYKELIDLSEKLSIYIKEILKFRNMTRIDESFLLIQAQQVQKSIRNPQIRNISLMKGN